MIEADNKLPFTAHLEELRDRLIRCFIAVGVGFVVSFAFKERLFNILARLGGLRFLVESLPNSFAMRSPGGGPLFPPILITLKSSP